MATFDPSFLRTTGRARTLVRTQGQILCSWTARGEAAGASAPPKTRQVMMDDAGARMGRRARRVKRRAPLGAACRSSVGVGDQQVSITGAAVGGEAPAACRSMSR